MSDFESFVIEMQIGTPLITSPYPMMLDGLLYYTVAAVHNLDPVQEQAQVLEILDSLLQKHECGIYHASQAIYLRTEDTPIRTIVVPQATTMGWEDYPHDLRRSIVYKTGRYRNRMTKNTAATPVAIRFYAHGDKKLCHYYLEQVSGVGRSHHQGHGEVLSCHVSTIPADYSIFDEYGELNRPLPVYWKDVDKVAFKDCVKEVRAIKPPYPIAEAVPHVSPMQKVQFI